MEFVQTMQCIGPSSKDLASSLAGLANGITWNYQQNRIKSGSTQEAFAIEWGDRSEQEEHQQSGYFLPRRGDPDQHGRHPTSLASQALRSKLSQALQAFEALGDAASASKTAKPWQTRCVVLLVRKKSWEPMDKGSPKADSHFDKSWFWDGGHIGEIVACQIQPQAYVN